MNFYPSDNNFTQALLVMLVTNIISEIHYEKTFGINSLNKELPSQSVGWQEHVWPVATLTKITLEKHTLKKYAVKNIL